MSGVNRVILLGNLGGDPEMKTFEDGNKLARFSLATNETYKNKNGERVTNTEWHRVVVRRGGLADVVEKYLKKSDQVYIEGKIRTRKWQDNDGNNRYTTEVHVDNLTMMGSPRGSNQSQQTTENESTDSTNAEEPSSSEESDDLPF